MLLRGGVDPCGFPRLRWRGLVLCAVLELGLLAGVPMRPDEIARLMRWLGQPRAERSEPDDAGRRRRPASAGGEAEAQAAGVDAGAAGVQLRRLHAEADAASRQGRGHEADHPPVAPEAGEQDGVQRLQRLLDVRVAVRLGAVGDAAAVGRGEDALRGSMKARRAPASSCRGPIRGE